MQDLVTILRDSMTGTILAVLAICLPVIIFLAGRRRKTLSYMLSDIRVLGVHEEVNPGRVQILFDGTPVTDVRLVMITVNNSGNESIRVDDFERALRFRWAEPARILTAEIVGVSPESLQPTIETGVNEIVLDPLLLNAGDWLRIKTLINQVSELSVDARVIGVKRIRKTSASGNFPSPRRLLLFAGVMSVVLVIDLVGRGLGLWVVNGRAEAFLVRSAFLGAVVFMVEELKTGVLELRDHYLEKRDRLK